MDLDTEKEVTEIYRIICEDTKLKAFEIIPEPNKTHKSPIQHVEHNLGIESWCVKTLCTFVHCQSFAEHSDSPRKLALSTVALLLNPNLKTFWNYRKQQVLCNNLDPYSELRFAALILTFKPKVPDLFAYRKWILQQIFNKHDMPKELLSTEFNVVLNAAGRFVNNHMAWDFAVWLLNWLDYDKNPGETLEYFWNHSEIWISSNISDYSAMHFRQRLIEVLFNYQHKLHAEFRLRFSRFLYPNFLSSKDKIENNVDVLFKIGIIISELEFNENLIHFYVNHEALWTHRRYLCYLLVRTLPQKINDHEFLVAFKQLSQFKLEKNANPFQLIFLKIHESFLTKATPKNHSNFVCNFEKWLKLFNILID